MNRDFQLEVLKKSHENYPDPLDWKLFIALYKRHYPTDEIPDGDEELEDAYMRSCLVVIQDAYCSSPGEREKRLVPPQELMATVSYLEEHGLLKAEYPYSGQTIPSPLITAKGIDYLADDGGLSAILNTVTVKFDVDNVRELVAAGLLTANVPEEKQSALMKAIREAPGAMLQTAVTKMVEKGMSDPVGTAKAVAGLFGITW